MANTRKQVEELLKLPPEERSAIAEELLNSLEGDEEEPGAAQAWAEEIQRRVAENAPGVPAEQVFAEGRARLKKRS